MHTIRVWILMWLPMLTASAQLSQPARWENELKFMEETYSVISMRNQGLALIRDMEDVKNGKAQWEVIWLDTLLQKKWSTTLSIEIDYVFLGYEHTSNNLNLMFRKTENESLRAQIIDINLVDLSIRQSMAEIKVQVKLTHYTVAEGNCVFGGYVGTDPILIIFETKTNTSLIVPGFFLSDSELLDVRPNDNGTFNILLSQRSLGKEKLIFRTFDRSGSILVEDEMLVDDEKTILSGACSILKHDEVLIGGAFALKNNRLATGLYASLINPFAEQPIQYMEFPQLQHFLDYLPDRKANKIREKSTMRESYGKNTDYRTNVSIHRIEEFNGGFAIFGESYLTSTSIASNNYSYPYSGDAFNRMYSPTIGSRTYPQYGRYNPYYNQNLVTTTELRIDQGFAVGFDFRGRRLWDYAIPMKDLKVDGYEQASDFTVLDGIPHFLFKHDGQLRFSNHSSDTLRISEAKEISIKLNTEWEEAKPSDNDDDGQVRHWYNRYFYVWGSANIKDKRQGVASRRVFYINKIALD